MMSIAAPTLTVAKGLARARHARRDVKLRIGIPLAIITLIVVGAIAVPLIYQYDPLQVDLVNRLKPPGTTMSNGQLALLGTTQVGGDLLAEIMSGARISLVIGAATLLLAGVVGVFFGLVAAHFGSVADTILMRLADIQLAFPSILLAILLASVLGQGVWNIILVLSISSWVVFARVTRSQVLSLRNREFVEAARTLGAGNAHLMFRTLLPGTVAPVIVVATTQFAQVILAEAALSFLGVGVPLGTPSLGSTIFNGTQYLTSAWWISTYPGILLVILMLCFGILGDALRDRFDPRLRSA